MPKADAVVSRPFFRPGRTRDGVPALLGWGHWMALGFVILLAAVAAAAPVLAPHDPYAQDLANILRTPSWTYPLGTDDVGRDILSRLMYGARTSMSGACAAGAVALLIGLPVGLVAGGMGGAVDAVLMRIVDAMLAFPATILALAVVGIIGPGLGHAMCAIGLVYSPRLARLLRAQVILIRQQSYVEAARLMGMGEAAIVVRHLLPNSLRPILVQWFLMLSFAFLAEAGLSFLGLGVQPPEASWGQMLARAYRSMSHSGWQIVAPGLAITASVLALNRVGDVASRWLARGA
ncbi:ABC transporter permease [Cupriavidus sp. NPDC089707]|uniref:ABC transporter permease n=1 Tax=Cupriavidus sp. NPDC089707 TaxID=3363963 RepID=UPI0038143065